MKKFFIKRSYDKTNWVIVGIGNDGIRYLQANYNNYFEARSALKEYIMYNYTVYLTYPEGSRAWDRHFKTDGAWPSRTENLNSAPNLDPNDVPI
jgi:hypothetical protein